MYAGKSQASATNQVFVLRNLLVTTRGARIASGFAKMAIDGLHTSNMALSS